MMWFSTKITGELSHRSDITEWHRTLEGTSEGSLLVQRSEKHLIRILVLPLTV